MQKNFLDGLSFNKQVVMITGAAAGIGLAMAQTFATLGANLVLLDRSDSVVKVAQELGEHHLGLVCDVTDNNSISSAFNQVEQRYGKLDVLINNAGIVILDEAEKVQESDWDLTMAINLKAPFLMAQAAYPLMERQGKGRIINLASQAAVVALYRHAAYCASKAAIVSMTQVLALEWGPKGITVNAISPTVVETELGKKAWAGSVGEAMKEKIPTKRFAQPEEVAGAAVYLASGHAGMINGANLVLDGGYTIQ